MSKFLSKKFIVMLLAGAANMAVIFGAPEAIKDLVPQILVALDSLVAVYVGVQGLIDHKAVGNGNK